MKVYEINTKSLGEVIPKGSITIKMVTKVDRDAELRELLGCWDYTSTRKKIKELINEKGEM